METNSQEDEATTAWTVADTKDFNGVNAREFQDALRSVITECNRTVVLDLARLTYISSAGLRWSPRCCRDGPGTLPCARSRVSEVFKISGFDQIIQTYDSQTEAIAALTGFGR